MRPIAAVCIMDGRPGHEKQSRSVLDALREMTSVHVIETKLSQTSGVRRLMQGIAWLVGRRRMSVPPGQRLDLVIGTGSGTHLPMIGYKLRRGAKLVTCMMPDPLLRSWFDLCLVPRHDRPPRGDKFFATFGPPCIALRTDRHDKHKGLILAGGVDPKSHHWDTTALMSQLDKLIVASPEMSWTISSSPRTPADAIGQLRQLAAGRGNVVFYSADETPRGWIESAYEENDRVWVTADSVSMVYEALTAGCRVGVLPVRWKHPENKFQAGIDDLKNNAMVVDFQQWINGAAMPSNVQPLNEAYRCAKEILQKWWPDRLA